MRQPCQVVQSRSGYLSSVVDYSIRIFFARLLSSYILWKGASVKKTKEIKHYIKQAVFKFRTTTENLKQLRQKR